MFTKIGSIKKHTESLVLPEDVKRTIKRLDNILKNDPHNTAILLKKAFLLYCNQSDGQAIDILQDIIQYDNGCIDAYVWLAELYLYHWADAEQAEAVLNQAISYGLVRADIYFLLACAYQKQRNVLQQLHFLRLSLALEPSWILPRLNLIEVLIDQKDIVSAKQELLTLKQYSDAASVNEKMHNYYETFITGRIITDTTRQLLQTYEQALE